jgi:PrcB C-terminal
VRSAKLRPRQILRLVSIAILAAGLTAFIHVGTTHPVDSYAACIEAGFPVLESNPPVCRDGKNNFKGTPLVTPVPAAAVTPAEFDLLVGGDTGSARPAASQVLINDQAAWQEYWRTVHAGISPLPPIIAVDFAKHSVVGIATGQRPTGGYAMKLTSITTSAAGTTVQVSESEPGPGCLTTMAITNRYMIVRASKLTPPADFRVITTKRACK